MRFLYISVLFFHTIGTEKGTKKTLNVYFPTNSDFFMFHCDMQKRNKCNLAQYKTKKQKQPDCHSFVKCMWCSFPHLCTQSHHTLTPCAVYHFTHFRCSQDLGVGQSSHGRLTIFKSLYRLTAVVTTIKGIKQTGSGCTKFFMQT